ncbi:hypothetical protein E8E14_013101 [Neopestalotiopsis sp. 37M]|nr:hypothetical protein E8E14_013101 [Neopestalotiopsis sp. 37M]
MPETTRKRGSVAKDDSLEAGELSFSKTQKWCSTAQRKIRFIDETYDISSLYDERSSPEDGQSYRTAAESPKSAEVPPTLVSPTSRFQAIEGGNRNLPPLPINEVSFDASVLSETLPGFHYDTPSSSGPQVVPGLQEMIEFGYYSPPDLRIPPSSYLQPFQTTNRHTTGARINPLLLGQPPALQWCDKQDVVLVRHFVDVIAPLFDHGGQLNSFATTIPQLATVHHPLLRAISSIAAISLNILGIPQATDPRQLRLDSYNDLGIIGSETAEMMDDQQFYTVSFLKIFDNLDRSIDPGQSINPQFGGMQGQQVMHLGQITLAEQLRQDMCWASLRVQLYFAVINQEPCSVLLTLDTNEYVLEHEDNDSQWARKMVLHLHNVVSYCFGDDKDGATYNELVSYAQEWVKLKPISFDPIFTADASGDDVFPAIYLLSDALSFISSIGNFDPAVYYSRALSLLISKLGGPVEDLDENILAALILLRTYEEITGRLGSMSVRDAMTVEQDPSDDTATHLSGVTQLLNSVSNYMGKGGLGEAASWIVLRQDMYFSLTRSHPLRTHLECYSASSCFMDDSPESIVNRIVLICAKIQAHAFGPAGRATVQQWDQLRAEADAWYESRPWDFRPMWVEDGDVFPKAWLSQSVQGAFISLLPKEIVHENIRLIMGLAISNPSGMTNKFIASHALQACGTYLTDPKEQKEALKFLDEVETQCGWRTKPVVDKLLAAWSMQ